MDKTKLKQLQSLFEHPFWEPFEAYLKQELEMHTQTLGSATDMNIMLRSQGARAMLLKILSLKDLSRGRG